MRKKHVQQRLFRRGGKRRGAGRNLTGARAGERHCRRPDFKASQPLHVVMRVVPAVGSLRRRTLYKAMRNATITAALREHFRIIHVSLQRTHVHMLVEAEHKAAARAGDAGLSSLCREVYQQRPWRWRAGPARQGVRRSLSRRGDHVTDSGAQRDSLRALELASPQRRSRGIAEHLARRSVLQRDPVPRLVGATRPPLDVADSRYIRSARGADSAELAARRGLEARGRSNQRARGAGRATIAAGGPRDPVL